MEKEIELQILLQVVNRLAKDQNKVKHTLKFLKDYKDTQAYRHLLDIIDELEETLKEINRQIVLLSLPLN